LKIEVGLPDLFVFGVEADERLGFAFGAKALLFARFSVLQIINAGAPEQDELLFHTDFSG